LLFSVLLIISCFAVVFLLGILVAIPLFGFNFNSLLSLSGNYDDPGTLRLLEYLQILQSFGLLIIPPLLAGFFFERNAPGYLHLDKPSRLMVFLLTLILMFVSLPVTNWMVSVNEMMKLPHFLKGVEDWMKSSEEEAGRLTVAFMKMPSFGGFLFNLAMIALLPAIGEEFLFRGLLQRLFKEWLKNVHVAIFITAFLFSAIHLQFYGFLPRFLLGLILGYLFYWSGSLWVPVFAHFINNGMVVVICFLSQRGLMDGDYEKFGATDSVSLIVAGFLGTVICLWLIARFGNRSGVHTVSREGNP